MLLAPVAFTVASVSREWLITHHASIQLSISDAAYRRQNSPELTAKVKHGEIAILLVWTVAFATLWRHHLAWKALGVWFAINAFISFCNTLRALGAHRSENLGHCLSTGRPVNGLHRHAWRGLDRTVGPGRDCATTRYIIISREFLIIILVWLTGA